MAPTDAELAQRIRDGDRDAWGQLCARYRFFILRVVLEARGRADAKGKRIGAQPDDLVQEVFIALRSALRNYQPGRGTVANLIAAVARHVVWHAAYESRTGGAYHERRAELTPAVVRGTPDPSPSPEAEAELSELATLLGTLLDQLKPSIRRVLVARDLEEQSVDEVAQRFGLRPGSVVSMGVQGRRALERLAAVA